MEGLHVYLLLIRYSKIVNFLCSSNPFLELYKVEHSMIYLRVALSTLSANLLGLEIDLGRIGGMLFISSLAKFF